MSIKTLTEKIGEGSREIRVTQSGDFSRAGSGSPTTNWSVISQIEAEADMILEEINALIEKDPLGTLGTPLGDLHIKKYGFLLKESNSDYPYKFTAIDVITEAPYLCAQLVAEEYFEKGPEACPFTPETFLEFDFNENHHKQKEWEDPFTTFKRPNVTIEYVEKMQRVNFDASKPVQEKPELKPWMPSSTPQI